MAEDPHPDGDPVFQVVAADEPMALDAWKVSISGGVSTPGTHRTLSTNGG
jgi:hypothetical protein